MLRRTKEVLPPTEFGFANSRITPLQEIVSDHHPEQIVAANKANVETLLALANTAFASAERIAA